MSERHGDGLLRSSWWIRKAATAPVRPLLFRRHVCERRASSRRRSSREPLSKGGAFDRMATNVNAALASPTRSSKINSGLSTVRASSIDMRLMLSFALLLAVGCGTSSPPTPTTSVPPSEPSPSDAASTDDSYVSSPGSSDAGIDESRLGGPCIGGTCPTGQTCVQFPRLDAPRCVGGDICAVITWSARTTHSRVRGARRRWAQAFLRASCAAAFSQRVTAERGRSSSVCSLR